MPHLPAHAALWLNAVQVTPPPQTLGVPPPPQVSGAVQVPQLRIWPAAPAQPLPTLPQLAPRSVQVTGVHVVPLAPHW